MKLFEKAGLPGWKSAGTRFSCCGMVQINRQKASIRFGCCFQLSTFSSIPGWWLTYCAPLEKYSFTQAFMAVVLPCAFFMAGRDPNASYQGPILEKNANTTGFTTKPLKKDKLALSKLKAQYPFLPEITNQGGAEAIILPCLLRPFIRMFLIRLCYSDLLHGRLRLRWAIFYLSARRITASARLKQYFSFPLIHNRPLLIWWIISYWAITTLLQASGPGKVDRNDPVVFNWPAGDSIILTPQRSWDLHQVRMQNGEKLPPGSDVIVRPLDKRPLY